MSLELYIRASFFKKNGTTTIIMQCFQHFFFTYQLCSCQLANTVLALLDAIPNKFQRFRFLSSPDYEAVG